jgi:hypothetical protein
MTPWERFMPEIAPEVAGCPDASIASALAAAAAEFCDRTHLWREHLDPETTTPGEAEYQLQGSGVVASVRSVVIDGDTELKPSHFADVTLVKADDTGRPAGFFLVNDTTIRFFPVPDGEYTFSAQVVLKPSKSARGVEDFLFESYSDDIVNGALYRLRKIPGKAWSDPTLAEMNRANFERGIASARVRDYRHIPLRVKPVLF